jgi:purine-nucleoside phosphorylase
MAEMAKVTNVWKRLEQSARVIQAATRRETLPETLVVLGSGFKGFEHVLSNAVEVLVSEITHFPVPRVAGHGASLVVGEVAGRDVCVLTGRVHMYEGYEAQDVVYPIRVLSTLGVQNVLITNACGSVDATIRPGTVVVASDQINLTGRNCLIGEDARELGPIFVDMGQVFHPEWRSAVLPQGPALGLTLVPGVYGGLLGPTYETPAETAMLHRLGLNVVGMSTVQEVIAARHLKLRCLVLSFVTNMTGGLGGELTHEHVIDLVAQHKDALHRLLTHAVSTAP